ncbi:glycosyltransferase [Candidatus Uhrbacteria bacterium]|nr:glycosyltransferase [Candidatus Uhrbacteria bacterium]
MSGEPQSRKVQLRAHFDAIAPELPQWNLRNAYYYQCLSRLLRTFIPPGHSVCEIGCGTAELLHAVEPKVGAGIDCSAAVVRLAQERYPELEFYEGDIDVVSPITHAFDYVVLSDVVGYLDDIYASLKNLHALCDERTRIIVTKYNRLWSPILTLAAKLRLKQPHPFLNWIGQHDVVRLLQLADFEIIQQGRRILFPKYIPWFSAFVNRVLAPLPLINRLCVIEYVIARQRPAHAVSARFRVSVIVPARDERGNIERIVQRMPTFGSGTEILFVEGHSTDGTLEEIDRVTAASAGKRNVRCVVQEGRGKWDAVRTGFMHAQGDVLMVFDADASIDPEALRKFYEIISTRRGEFVFGSRLIYPMERGAMQPLNTFMNRRFGAAVARVTGQHVTDAFCGTKVLFKRDVERMPALPAAWEQLDRYGDLTLFFGAAALSLKMVEIPVHYRARAYGASKMLRFQEGWRFLRALTRMWWGLRS